MYKYVLYICMYIFGSFFIEIFLIYYVVWNYKKEKKKKKEIILNIWFFLLF